MTSPSSEQWRALFEPRGVVVAGASSHPGKFGFVALHNILRHDYPGAVFATPAVLRAQVETHVTKTEKIGMEIKRIGSQPSSKGPADWFTGTVRIDPLFQPNAPARTSGASVTFEPGARTAWHTHPLGQTLIVTAGFGWVQQEGGPIEEIHPGDVISIPPGEKHWHGATPTTAMTHIAIQEALDGKAVDWLEKVSDEQYRQ